MGCKYLFGTSILHCQANGPMVPSLLELAAFCRTNPEDCPLYCETEDPMDAENRKKPSQSETGSAGGHRESA